VFEIAAGMPSAVSAASIARSGSVLK